ncbi:hypothetical protein [Tengunoibacter tsumagoiensis]|uniref:DUF2029 domain-containing protein n=1 Tax=Tengunoibacter tsumagoiensis TaxID=2014871 RepID=A0A401ZW95_9CHLR|nr:hypothetical protein [Tengunoibacter tsumagoiensis]GCE11072.1 hypothetical protein KTT_09310 [Tengunoibacter tsumagoiensis]
MQQWPEANDDDQIESSKRVVVVTAQKVQTFDTPECLKIDSGLLRYQQILQSLWDCRLICLGVAFYLLLYLSAAKTHWFDYFYSGGALHSCCRGMDFYQIPNGYWAYTHGGSLNGVLPQGVHPYWGGYTNINVYHPLFTLLMGSFLILFEPDASFYVWMFLKIAVNLLLLFYFFRRFRTHPAIYFAVFTALINFTQYLEMEIAQFQYVLNLSTFLLLMTLAQSNRQVTGSLYYAIGLLTKPIGFLWLPVFFFKKQYKLLVLGMLMFVISTAFFWFNQSGLYYTDNLMHHFFSADPGGPTQIMTLAALLHYTLLLSPGAIAGLRLLCLLAVLFLCSLKRINLFKGMFISTVYYLLFYDLVYEYQYTILIPLIAICLLTCPEFQKLSAKIYIIWICLPNVFFLMHLFRVAYDDNPFFGPNPTDWGWQLIVISRIAPLIGLTICVLKPDIKPAASGLKRFAFLIGKINKKLEVFG